MGWRRDEEGIQPFSIWSLTPYPCNAANTTWPPHLSRLRAPHKGQQDPPKGSRTLRCTRFAQELVPVLGAAVLLAGLHGHVDPLPFLPGEEGVGGAVPGPPAMEGAGAGQEGQDTHGGGVDPLIDLSKETFSKNPAQRDVLPGDAVVLGFMDSGTRGQGDKGTGGQWQCQHVESCLHPCLCHGQSASYYVGDADGTNPLHHPPARTPRSCPIAHRVTPAHSALFWVSFSGRGGVKAKPCPQF